jgi:hypothetical protein
MEEYLPVKNLCIAIGFVSIAVGILFNEWTLAALFSSDGVLIPHTRIMIWAFDSCAVIWGVLCILFRGKNFIINTNLFFLSIILLSSLIEVTLRISPTFFGREIANGLLTRYTKKPDGIYYIITNCQGQELSFMKPNYKTMMYYNGYRWKHETDRFGFRNLGNRDRVDIMLLGDSFVYGHGLEIDQTIPFFIEKNTSLKVANLGRQGDCSFQEVYLLSQYITHFKPRVVCYFFYENDILDLYLYLTEKDMKEFIQRPIEDISDCQKDDLPHLHYTGFRSKALLSKYKLKPYVLRIIEWRFEKRRLNEKINKVMKPAKTTMIEKEEWKSKKEMVKKASYMVDLHRISKATVENSATIPGLLKMFNAGSSQTNFAEKIREVIKPVKIVEHREKRIEETSGSLSDNNDPCSLGWRYTTRAILKMKYISELNHATLILIPITPKNKKQYDLLKKLSTEHQIPFIDTWSIFTSDNSLFLPHDGHFSEKGARTTSRLIVKYLSEHGMNARKGAYGATNLDRTLNTSR